MSKSALILGLTGQDGSYLAELLLGKGYNLYGMVRRSSTINTWRIDHLPGVDASRTKPLGNEIKCYYGDLSDANSIVSILVKSQPDEVYNLGAMSHVRASFDIPEYTGQITGLGTTKVLEALLSLGMTNTKYYQASSSEMFGSSLPPQSEDTPFKPQSPYGAAKLYGYWMTKLYRSGYNMFACNGILFNHESPRRGEVFVTKKVVRAAVRIKLGLQKELRLGNLDAIRDWGYAKDFMEAVYLIMQHDVPDDFVVATGQSHTVREFVERVFKMLNLDMEQYVIIDPKYFRPNEVDTLLGDATKIKKVLGWKPKVGFDELVQIMVDSVMEEEKTGKRWA